MEDLIGEEGRGFEYILHGLNPERILIAAEAVGLGMAALNRASRYARERIVFDRPIGQNQGIAFPLARAHMELHAAELAIREAAWRYDHGLPCGEHANTAKFLAAEAGYAAADQAVQTLGGMGYAGEYHVERYWREARLMRLAPVSQELVQAFVATNVLAYYDVFEQSLALANIARMLRPGGLFVTNNGVFELPPVPLEWKGFTDVAYMQVPDVGETIDRLFWYQRH